MSRKPPETNNEAERASESIARTLEQLGIPVPSELPALVAVPGHADHDASHEPDQSRYERLIELEWPRRAVDIAMHAHQSPAIAAVRAWNPKHSSLVLAGQPGTGKTVAAAWCALRFRSPKVFRFVRAATLVRVGRFNDAWGEWMRAPALCIDDLGAEYVDAKGSFVSDLDELIDTFYSDSRPLIITTNLDGAAFSTRYGPRVNDRITECATWAPVSGGSMRRNERP